MQRNRAVRRPKLDTAKLRAGAAAACGTAFVTLAVVPATAEAYSTEYPYCSNIAHNSYNTCTTRVGNPYELFANEGEANHSGARREVCVDAEFYGYYTAASCANGNIQSSWPSGLPGGSYARTWLNSKHTSAVYHGGQWFNRYGIV